MWKKAKNALAKGKKTAQKATAKTKDKVKDKAKETKQNYKDLKRKSFFEDWHLAKGEFVAAKDLRETLSSIAYLLLLLLFAMTFGELLFAFIAYIIASQYSYLVESNLYSLSYDMITTFFVVLIFDLFCCWSLTTYQTAEEKTNAVDIRRRRICVQVSYYISYVAVIGLIVLMVKCSHYFKGLRHGFSSSLTNLMQTYNQSVDNKEQMDRIQWYYDCCGSQKSEDWLRHRFNDNKSSVPFSCCKKDAIRCDFSNYKAEDIHSVGCLSKVVAGFNGLKTAVQWYRLIEMSALFGYVVLIDIIQRSIHSQYELGANPPISSFPSLYVASALLIVVCLYFFTFTSLE